MSMTILFWCALGAILYTYGGYPLILSILGWVSRRVPKKGSATPAVSLIISAYNEEGVIRRKIENSLALDYPQDLLEIIVASESSDGTNAIVSEYAARGVRLCAYAGRAGKAATLCRTMPQATGEIIVFSDANAMYAPEAIRRIVENFADPRVGAVSGLLEYTNEGSSFMGMCEQLFWRYETTIKRLESDLFSILGANGSIFAVRRELYDPISEVRGDDFELPIRVILRGYAAVLEPRAISYEVSAEKPAVEFARKKRIVRWNVQSGLILLRQALAARKWFLCFQLVSHKLLRWSVPVFLIMILAATPFLASPTFQIALIGQSTVYGLGLAAYVMDRLKMPPPKVCTAPFYFCMANLAVLSGIVSLLVGQRRNTWEKVR